MPSSRLATYFRSQSVRAGIFVGMVWYISYGVSFGNFFDLLLGLTSFFVALALPHYAKFSNSVEEWASYRTALITVGRFARFIVQYAFNVAAFSIMATGNSATLAPLGGPLGAAFVTTLASFGAQAIAQSLARNGRGDLVTNVTYAISLNVVFASLGTWGIIFLSYAYMGLASGIGGSVFLLGILSDLRGIMPHKGGIGVFFGTFNPFHSTHLEIVKRLIVERGVKRVYIHPTIIPRLHKDALEQGKLQKTHVAGYDIYERTPLADPMVNYLPFGNKILPPKTRLEIIKAAILHAEEHGILPAGVVQVISYEGEYEQRGFGGVLERILRENPGERVHLGHGSDLGGMWIRSIADEKCAIWPLAVVRRDCISATAIRKGARGMAPPVVEAILDQLVQRNSTFTVDSRSYRYDNGTLKSS